jgi:hypothetical protein
MAFGDFIFPQVKDDLALTIDDADLYSNVRAVPLREEFASTVAEGTVLALAINTEKARSEFIIAPILLELRRRLGGAFSLFSGVEFNVEPSKGLNGVCDFILSGSPRQSILTAPLVTIVEAKNDNLRSGLGQCIASMYAAQVFNQKAGDPVAIIHGVATTGTAWKFLKLMDKAVTLDLKEYYVDDPGKILGVLEFLVRPS